MIYGAVLAGGTGERLGLGMPKQFYKIGTKPILIHSVEAFLKVEEFDCIIVSSPKEYIDKTNELIEEYIENTEKIIVIDAGHGGEDRGYTYGRISEKDIVLDVIDTDSDNDFGANDVTSLKKLLLVGTGDVQNPTQP